MPNERSYEAALRRSNQIQADLPEHPEKYVMLTGDRPTGRLHFGHYFGTLVERVRLQELGVKTNIIIADYHDDFCTLRRELVDEGLMQRSDGTYQRNIQAS